MAALEAGPRARVWAARLLFSARPPETIACAHADSRAAACGPISRTFSRSRRPSPSACSPRVGAECASLKMICDLRTANCNQNIGPSKRNGSKTKTLVSLSCDGRARASRSCATFGHPHDLRQSAAEAAGSRTTAMMMMMMFVGEMRAEDSCELVREFDGFAAASGGEI